MSADRYWLGNRHPQPADTTGHGQPGYHGPKLSRRVMNRAMNCRAKKALRVLFGIFCSRQTPVKYKPVASPGTSGGNTGIHISNRQQDRFRPQGDSDVMMKQSFTPTEHVSTNSGIAPARNIRSWVAYVPITFIALLGSMVIWRA